MPIHLPPVSRRTFLRHTLVGAAALLGSRGVAAAQVPTVERWALLSDTHIAADPARIMREVNMAEHLRQVVASVLAQMERPTQMAINGDLALLDGQPGDYTQLLALLQPAREAGLPITLNLGNHDARDIFWAGVAEASKAPRPVEQRHVSVVAGALANWFFLDTLEVVNVTPGVVGAAQLQWLARELDARANKPAMVMMHHNPMLLPPEPGKKVTGLKDTAELMATLLPRRQVKALIFGHTHRWSVEAQEGLHLINLPPVAYAFNPKQTSGWVAAAVRAGGMELELHALDAAHPLAGAKAELSWRA